MNSITQQNASSSEELASNAEQLATQAEYMLELISYFKTNKTNNVLKSHVQSEFSSNLENRRTIKSAIIQKSTISSAKDDKLFEEF